MPSIEERFNRAIQLEKTGDYQNALIEYASIIDDKSSFKDAHLNLGSIYSRMEMFAEAMNCYKNALKINEDYLTYFNIGSIHYKNGNYKDAVLALSKSRKLKNDFVLSILVMGLSFSRLNNFKAAESCFFDVLAINPGNRVALTAMAIIYFDKKMYEKSLEYINRMINIETGTVRMRKLRSDVLYHLNRLNESSSELKYIKESSDEFKLYDEFIKTVPVELYDDKYGSLDEKITLIREKAKNPEDKKSLITLSFCHLLKGETNIAIDYLFEAKKRILN